MARHLPDSTALINFGRGVPAAVRWFQTMLNSVEEVGCCAITVGECFGGAAPAQRQGWLEVFNAFVYWETLPEDAMQAGIWQFDYARRGIQLKLPDLLIAAVAKRLDATVVTENVKDFRMEGVRVMSLFPA